MRANKLFLFIILALVLPLFFYACGSAPTPPEEALDTAQSNVVEVKKEFKLENTVFVGDSNTYHLATYGLIPHGQIWTGSECYLTLEPDVYQKHIVFPQTKKQMTVSEAAAMCKPEFMVITLGTDGALSLDRNGFRLSFVQLIESIQSASSETEIFVQSIFPVCKGKTDVRFTDVKKTNAKFSQANAWLCELADELGIKYLDTASVLSDASGNLKSEYNTDHNDGYHLNRKGLLEMLKYIEEHAND